MDLEARRRLFAEELDAVCGFRSPGLLEAFAAVPRETFVPPGPWQVLSLADYSPVPGAVAQARATADADPARLYHNIGVAIDPTRRLFNGHPATLATWIDTLALTPGARVLHVGAGLGYYTAVMAHLVGPTGRVLAIEIDGALAAAAAANLAAMPWTEVRCADGTGQLDGPFDAILINAGVTHPRAEWLDALASGGRMLLPLTVQMDATIGKGVMIRLVRNGDEFAANLVTLLAIYSAVGLRDAALNAALAQAMRQQPFPALTRLRRDAHDASASCWVHAPGWCLAM